MAKAPDKNSSVKSVSRALSILEAFSLERSELSLNEISKITGFYKSTILRQTETLIGEGFLVKDPESGKYKLGAKLYLLGQIYIQSSNLLKSSAPVLQEVVDTLQETAAIFVIDKFERLCLKMVSGPHFIRATFVTGSRMPIYAGASGKALLAFSPKSLIERVVKKTGLEAFTELTITNPDEFKTELARVRKRGWSISWGERVPSAVTISVPVFGEDGSIACSLSASGPADRLTSKITPENIRTLQHAGRKLSIDIGYLGDYWDKTLKQPVVLEHLNQPTKE
jgi:IclR family KDG regulon transcriptional repressor